ncbi:MAG: ComEC/Rec2 family competence protein [Alphaproteobacteria bacterium]|nr:ComEC/Rec2 family competence protein [Alphaproteobacteria bacterium]
MAALCYLGLSGASGPSERAFLMVGIVLLGVLVDRPAISMCLLAIAAIAVLALEPESVLGPSFQMSFGAVLALIALYEGIKPTMARWRSRAGPVGRATLYVGGLTVTTFVAGMATAPFALYHFGRFVSFGAVANLLAIPVTSLWVMPLAMLVLVLVPWGIEGPALTAMGWGIDVILWTAREVAAWPDATFLAPAMPGWGLASSALGLCWLCL